MKLSQLLEFDNIIVQCHNTPDADAISSGMALTWYLQDKGKNARFVYGGNFEITKSNLKLMVADLGVDIHYVQHQAQLSQLLNIDEAELPELLITIDSQYGEGNVRKFKAKYIAVIDHHQISSPLPVLSEVRTYLASCSTLMWDMLREEGYTLNDNINLSTALYYGLLTDSNNFSEIHHPLDMDMRDELKFNSTIITKLKNSNISREELRIAGMALLGSEHYHDEHYSIVKTDPCDPNILGMISDMLLEVEDVDSCLVFSIHDDSVKVSVRSCVKEVKADELAKFICDGVGNGGGHLSKAGGTISRSLLEKKGLAYDDSSIHQFLRDRMKAYYSDTEIIYANDYKADLTEMEHYTSRKITLGYVHLSDFLPVGKKVVIRALEGDYELEIMNDHYVIIGVRGELYIIMKDCFEECYKIVDGDFLYPGEYEPSVRDLSTGKSTSLLPFIKACTFNSEDNVYAKRIDKRTKVFTKCRPDTYRLGNPGDYLFVSGKGNRFTYIFDKEMFRRSFEKVVD